jgi:hypothetical protein
MRLSNHGSSRAVLIVGNVALKIARHCHGTRCNTFEGSLYATANPRRRDLLCPVLWRSPFGAILAMRAAQPCNEADIPEIRAAMEGWDYMGPGDVESPLEPNPRNWGRVDGRLVALDYSVTVV